MHLSDRDAAQFEIAVRSCLNRPDLELAIDCIHQQLQDAIDLMQPRCESSGRCCRFDAYGHRLFVTTAELAVFLHRLPKSFVRTNSECPFQIERLCGVHEIRPFGCRIFFCDPDASEGLRKQYEQTHAQVKSLHAELSVPYFYVEWRAALRAVRDAEVVA